jgi:hypothetical protein
MRLDDLPSPLQYYFRFYVPAGDVRDFPILELYLLTVRNDKIIVYGNRLR